MTEYFNQSVPKTGMMRIKLKSDYTESVNQDEEKVFTGYDLSISSVFYPSSTLAYTVGYDKTDQMTYLIQYDWDTNPVLWPIREFSDDPNITPPVFSNPHKNSIIYAEKTSNNPNDFPVKGFIVGGTSSIWSFSDCRAPDFGFDKPSYI